MKAPFFPMNRRALVKITTVVITFFFVAILFTQISPGDIVKTLYQVNLLCLIAGFFLYTGCYFFRTARFYYLLNREIPVRDLFPVVCLHNVINMVLPAKTGELSYVYLVNKHHGRTIGEGIATLLIARIFDIISISALFLVSFVIVVHSLTVNTGFIYGVILVLGLFIVLLFLFLNKSRSFLEAFVKLCSFAGIEKTKPVHFILIKGEETVAALEIARTTKEYSFITIFSLSLGVWGCLYAFTALMVIAMDIPAGLSAIVFACTFAFMTAILPVQGIGNFGTFEAGWTLGFLSIGVPAELAVSTGFSYHIINSIFNGILGIAGIILLHSKTPGLTEKSG
jgi:glycosyltransferase 2 family protein